MSDRDGLAGRMSVGASRRSAQAVVADRFTSGESMSAEPALASRDLAGQEEFTIRLVPLPELWPPPDEGTQTAIRPARPGCAGPPPDLGPALPRQFAAFLVEGLAGLRPARQLLPWLSERGRVHLHRLMPLFADGHQPRVLRVLTARPAPDVIEMTMVVAAGDRTRAVAVRLERAPLSARKATPPWLCTDTEAA